MDCGRDCTPGSVLGCGRVPGLDCGPCAEPTVGTLQKKIHCLCKQIKSYEQQLESAQMELENARSRASQCCRELEDLRRKICQRDDAIACQESRLEEMRFELKEKERSCQRSMDCLQEKLCQATEQYQQREAALQCCKQEVNNYMTQLEETRNNCTCEIQQRETCLRQMKDDMRQMYEELRCKSDQNTALERNLVELKGKYHQMCSSLKECDTRNGCLNDKVQTLECQSTRDKTQFSKELEECECRNRQQCTEIQNLATEARSLKRCLQEREEDLNCCQEEKDALCRELTNEKEEACNFRERCLTFENDNKEICRLLQQKVKRIKELEEILCCKQEELEQCQCCVDELNCRIRKMNVSKDGGGDGECDCIREKLREALETIKRLELELEETKKRLEWAVCEMECLAKEVKRLTCELEEAKKEICEKNSMISDLQQVIQHAEHDLESRMRRADEQLQVYEQDIQEKSRALNECEDRAIRLQHTLCDKDLENDKCEQKMCRLQTENNSLCGKLRDCEECREGLQRQNNETRNQLAEVCQELTVIKEQYQCQDTELQELRHDFDCNQRELEKSNRELENLRGRLQAKQAELNCVSEEKCAANSKLSSLTMRHEQETCQLQQQMADMRCRLETEIEQLKSCQCQLEDTNASLAAKVSSSQRQQAGMEKTYCQKLDSVVREVNLVRAKLGDREDQLQAAKDCLTVKESEIMRLKLRLCSMDRCCNPCSNPCDTCNSNKPCDITINLDKQIAGELPSCQERHRGIKSNCETAFQGCCKEKGCDRPSSVPHCVRNRFP